MRVFLWLVEGTWQGCVDAARPLLPADPEVTLLHVAPSEVEEATTGALAGLLGRGRPGPGRHPAERISALSDQAAAALLNAAEARLGRQARQQVRRGRVERLVVEAAEDADLLVWPDETPAVDSIPRRPHTHRRDQAGHRIRPELPGQPVAGTRGWAVVLVLIDDRDQVESGSRQP